MEERRRCECLPSCEEPEYNSIFSSSEYVMGNLLGLIKKEKLSIGRNTTFAHIFVCVYYLLHLYLPLCEVLTTYCNVHHYSFCVPT